PRRASLRDVEPHDMPEIRADLQLAPRLVAVLGRADRRALERQLSQSELAEADLPTPVRRSSIGRPTSSSIRSRGARTISLSGAISAVSAAAISEASLT